MKSIKNIPLFISFLISITACEPVEELPPEDPPPLEELVAWYNFEGNFEETGLIKNQAGDQWDLKVNKDGKPKSGVGYSGEKSVHFNGRTLFSTEGSPTSNRSQLTISLYFKTEDPSQNYKLLSSAWWHGGLDASGIIVGTHYPEVWADHAIDFWAGPHENKENNFKPAEWNHLVVVYDGAALREYTNGKLINEWPASGQPIGAGTPMVLGGWNHSFGFNGEIDEVRIYGRAMRLDQIPDAPSESLIQQPEDPAG